MNFLALMSPVTPITFKGKLAYSLPLFNVTIFVSEQDFTNCMFSVDAHNFVMTEVEIATLTCFLLRV